VPQPETPGTFIEVPVLKHMMYPAYQHNSIRREVCTRFAAFKQLYDGNINISFTQETISVICEVSFCPDDSFGMFDIDSRFPGKLIMSRVYEDTNVSVVLCY